VGSGKGQVVKVGDDSTARHCLSMTVSRDAVFLASVLPCPLKKFKKMPLCLYESVKVSTQLVGRQATEACARGKNKTYREREREMATKVSGLLVGWLGTRSSYVVGSTPLSRNGPFP